MEGRPAIPHQDGGYEDFLRALGWELDQVTAAAVTIDELDDELFVSWLTRLPSDASLVVKRRANIGVEERATMLQDAYGRRGQGALRALVGSRDGVAFIG